MNLGDLRILESAVRNRQVLDTVSPVAAESLGVLPIQMDEDKAVLACVRQSNPDCLKILARYLKRRVHLVPVDAEVLAPYIRRAYSEAGPINHHTFPTEDFVRKKENFEKLLSSKKDEPPSPGSELEPDQVLFLDLTYESLLENIDHPYAANDSQTGSMAIPFRVIREAPILCGDPLAPEVVIMLRKDYFCDGVECLQGIEAARILSFPYIIHPTEVQITGARADGTCTFYVYDHLEEVPRGGRPRWDLEYYFLAMGSRWRRALRIEVEYLGLFEKASVNCTNEPIAWEKGDLKRWLRLDRGGGLGFGRYLAS